MGTEFRVVWKREGCEPRRKRYMRRSSAERFMTLLGPEPWLAFDREADEYFCCSGYECGCGGITVKEDSDLRRKDYPPNTCG